MGTSELTGEIRETVQIQVISAINLIFQLYFCKKQRDGVTFHFFGGFDILRVPPDGADESADVGEVHLTADKVLQALQVLPELPAWPRLQMVNLSFKCLKYTINTRCKCAGSLYDQCGVQL